MDIKLKPRPKVGDRVKFQFRGLKIGIVLAIAKTGVHFLIEWSSGRYKTTRRLIGINAIIEILPEIDFRLTPIECKPESQQAD